MNIKQFKIHLMRGLIRPEYFYIPILKSKAGIFIKVHDQNGNDVFVNGLRIDYKTYRLFHIVYNDNGTWIVDQDAYYKGYAFNQDYDWRYPPAVPNPSSFEIYPVPDFKNDTPVIDNSAITALGSDYATFTFNEPKSLIELKNMRSGIYEMTIRDIVIPDTYELSGTSYYPTYYNDYDNSDGAHYVSHSYGVCQIDKNNKFSGFAMYSLTDPNDHHPTGYNFYCITDKFKNNVMPVLVTLNHVYKIRCVASLINVGLNLSYSNSYVTYENCTYDEQISVDRLVGWKVYVDDEYIGCYTHFELIYDAGFNSYIHYNIGDADFKGDIYQEEDFGSSPIGREKIYATVPMIAGGKIFYDNGGDWVINQRYTYSEKSEIYTYNNVENFIEFSKDASSNSIRSTYSQNGVTATNTVFLPFSDDASLYNTGEKHFNSAVSLKLGADVVKKPYRSYYTYETWKGSPTVYPDDYPEIILALAAEGSPFSTNYLYFGDGMTLDKYKKVLNYEQKEFELDFER